MIKRKVFEKLMKDWNVFNSIFSLQFWEKAIPQGFAYPKLICKLGNNFLIQPTFHVVNFDSHTCWTLQESQINPHQINGYKVDGNEENYSERTLPKIGRKNLHGIHWAKGFESIHSLCSLWIFGPVIGRESIANKDGNADSDHGWKKTFCSIYIV